MAIYCKALFCTTVECQSKENFMRNIVLISPLPHIQRCPVHSVATFLALSGAVCSHISSAVRCSPQPHILRCPQPHIYSAVRDNPQPHIQRCPVQSVATYIYSAIRSHRSVALCGTIRSHISSAVRSHISSIIWEGPKPQIYLIISRKNR